MSLPGAATRFLPLVEEASTTYQVPEGVILAIVGQESGWNPRAMRIEQKINDASYGLMQLLARTARSLGYTGSRGEAAHLTGLFDPKTNIDLGCKLLVQNLKLAGNWTGAISAYNGGWRPKIGFGRPADHELSICLARDQKTGECITRRKVPLGEYANQPYVDAVLARWKAYRPGDFGNAD